MAVGSARAAEREVTWAGSKKKIKTGFVATAADPAAAVRATRSEPDTPCVGVAKCSAGNREGRDAARGSSLRNCTFWKEPSNHEFRVFVDEYLISNFMMSFLPPIAARRGGYQKSNLWRWAPKHASFGTNLQPGSPKAAAPRPELPTTPIITGQPAAGS